jgi:transglutaminase-like putative cysteine protease
MSTSAIHTLRHMTGIMRGLSATVLLAFTMLILMPTVQAAQPSAARPADAPAPVENVLGNLRDTALRARDKAEHGQGHKDEDRRLLQHEAELGHVEDEAEADFAAVEQHLESHGLPEEIKQRHRQAVADYRVKMQELKQHLKEFKDARARKDSIDERRRLNDLADFLQKEQKTRPHQPFDPKNLPFGTPDGKVRAPKEKKEELDDIIRPQVPVKVAATELTPGLLAAAMPTPGASPTPEDLAETEDVQITQAIRDQAAALHHNPVEIYNWVRNTIEFLPTYGSIQGSDLTLQTRRGNAFDTASLLIALLRASNIPARYAYGTIQVPADQVMNWVGGVKTPEAAQSLLGQGGIPTTALVSGGRIAAFKLEHVWVSAFVDYLPSRGAVNKVGDTWVPLDGSFKQYTYTDGMNLQTAVPLDAQTLVDQVKTGATLNETEGWVQNLNNTVLQTALTDYQNRIKTYIDSQNPNATVGDVLGTKRITEQKLPILMGSLPYAVLVSGAKTAALADTLRAQYRFAVYTGIDYNPLGGGDIQRGSEVFIHTVSLPKLAGGKLTLSFIPASQADTDLISSYLPQPHPDGTPIQPSELPASLPGYLIHLKAEYRIDGQLVASGGDFVMGNSYIASSALYSPNKGWEEAADNVQTAGEYWATYVGANVPQARLAGVKAKLEQTKAKLEQFQADPGNTAPVADLTKEDLTGDLLFSTILGYFAANEASQQVEQKSAGAVAYRKSGFGHFGVSAKVVYRYGIPRQVSFPGLMMDVDHWKDTAVMKDNNSQRKIAYTRQGGTRLSAYEHLIPEKFWTDAQNPGEGVSAVKAITKAAAEGQKIYMLTSANASLVYQLQIDTAIRAEIQNAVNAGLTVTVHEKPITVSGWIGTGYIINNPATGAGAYKISGGANGGSLWVPIIATIAMTVAFVPFVLIAAYSGIIILSIVTSFILAIAWVSAKLNMPSSSPWRTFIVDIFGGILATIIGGLFTGIALPALVVGILISLIYAIFDAFILAHRDEEYIHA